VIGRSASRSGSRVEACVTTRAAIAGASTALWGPRDREAIDDGMSVTGWTDLLNAAGFRRIDVVLRDADQVIIGALKSVS